MQSVHFVGRPFRRRLARQSLGHAGVSPLEWVGFREVAPLGVKVSGVSAPGAGVFCVVIGELQTKVTKGACISCSAPFTGWWSRTVASGGAGGFDVFRLSVRARERDRLLRPRLLS